MPITKRLFNPHLKTLLHAIQLVLVITVIGISAARVFMKNQPRTRANTISLGMASKSLIILQYQLLTEHTNRFKKWASRKAFAILNGLEIVFWAAVVFLMIQANLSRCFGLGCTLSWVIIGIAIVLTLLAIYVFGVTFFEFRDFKKLRAREKDVSQVSSAGPDAPSEFDTVVKHATSFK